MNEEQIKALGNAEFFRLFMDACKQTYAEYCEMQAEKEGLNSYSEPMFEFAMDEAEKRCKEGGEMLESAATMLNAFAINTGSLGARAKRDEIRKFLGIKD